MEGYIYKITNKVNGKVYIGQTVDPNRRWRGHKCEAKKNKDSHLYRAIRLQGIENFTFEVIATIDRDLMNQMEKLYIFLHKSFGNGYNSTTGGKSRHSFSDETRAKMRAKKQNVSEETRKKMRIAHSNRAPISEETRRKLAYASATRVQAPRSEETRKKMRESGAKRVARDGVSAEHMAKFHEGNRQRWIRWRIEHGRPPLKPL